MPIHSDTEMTPPAADPPITDITCRQCEFDGNCTEDTRTHIAKEHGIIENDEMTKYNCGQCEFFSEDIEKLNIHIDDNHKPEQMPSYSCNECEALFSNKPDLELHIGDRHVSKTFQCKKCSMHFEDQESLKQHMSDKHIIINVYNCKSCEYRTLVLQEWKIHADTNHQSVRVNLSKTDFQCSLCKKELRLELRGTLNYSVKNAINVHLNE